MISGGYMGLKITDEIKNSAIEVCQIHPQIYNALMANVYLLKTNSPDIGFTMYPSAEEILQHVNDCVHVIIDSVKAGHLKIDPTKYDLSCEHCLITFIMRHVFLLQIAALREALSLPEDVYVDQDGNEYDSVIMYDGTSEYDEVFQSWFSRLEPSINKIKVLSDKNFIENARYHILSNKEFMKFFVSIIFYFGGDNIVCGDEVELYDTYTNELSKFIKQYDDRYCLVEAFYGSELKKNKNNIPAYVATKIPDREDFLKNSKTTPAKLKKYLFSLLEVILLEMDLTFEDATDMIDEINYDNDN